jgi:hypothetical protein
LVSSYFASALGAHRSREYGTEDVNAFLRVRPESS